MQVMIRAYDGEGMLEQRMRVRGAHLENLKRIEGKILCAGGLLDEEGKMKGSVLVMEFADEGQLSAYLESEPYLREGVWEKVVTEVMNVVILDGQKVGQ